MQLFLAYMAYKAWKQRHFGIGSWVASYESFKNASPADDARAIEFWSH